MRRQHFWWTFLVGGVVCTMYGGFTLIYHFNHGNGLSVHALILLILGVIALVLYLILYLLTILQKRKEVKETPPEPVVEEEKKEESKPEPVVAKKVEYKPRNDVVYERGPVSKSRYDNDTSYSYIKKVGYGPVLEVSGNRIRDMRNNTYYRLESSYVYFESGGLAYEISGDRIRAITGGYLYEISGGNINKIYGGFFASISGGYIVKYDGSERYEMTSSLNKQKLLVVAAILFGAY